MFIVSCTKCHFTCVRVKEHGQRQCPVCGGPLKSEPKKALGYFAAQAIEMQRAYGA